jgi:GEVED domain
MKTCYFIAIFLLLGINDSIAKGNIHSPHVPFSNSSVTDSSFIVQNSTTSFTNQVATYCTPTNTIGCVEGDAIKLFRLKGETSVLNNNSGVTCTSSFSDFTTSTPIINLAKGKSYWGKMSVGYVSNYVSIWIDNDDDGLFESDERVLNNLLVSTAETYFSIFIPLSFTVGNHRMRLRNVYYFPQPEFPTDPCDSYTWGETEDYTINIANSGSSYTVSTYTPDGSCNYTTQTSVDGFSNNNSNFLPLVDSLNSLIAQIYPTGNNLGLVSYSYYKHNGAMRQDQFGRYYLDRNITIKSTYNPSSTINVRLPYLTTELNTLIAQPGSGVTSQFDLVTTENSGICANMYQNYTCQSVIFPTGFGAISGNRFLDFTNLNYLGTFYIHGGSTAIGSNVATTSISSVKSGNWNDKSTWTGCGNLPTETIDVIINAGHKIILNNTMGIQKCRKLTVLNGAVFDNTANFFLAKP